jgi:hypothetical protein
LDEIKERQALEANEQQIDSDPKNKVNDCKRVRRPIEEIAATATLSDYLRWRKKAFPSRMSFEARQAVIDKFEKIIMSMPDKPKKGRRAQ